MDTIYPAYSYDEFTGIYRRYWGKLYAICYRYTQDEDISKDMVQNIFVTLWRREVPLENEEQLERYLSKAAKYQIFNNVRDDKTTPLKNPDELGEDTADCEYQDPYHQLIGNEFSRRLEKHIALLKEPARTILLLRAHDALSYKEIANRTGLALKTVEYHLAKARRVIRERMGI